MAKDFKAKQLRAHKLIASGSDVSGGVPSLLIYSASSATNQSGGIPTAGAGALLANVGSDVFLFVSGAKGDGSALSRKDATLFVSDGDALDMETNNVILAFIQGRKVNLDNPQKYLYRKFKTKP